MSRTYFALAALTLALAVGGCGGGGSSKKSSSSSEAPSAQQQVRDDATAKSGAREAITELEACYVDQMDYAPCAANATGAGITAKGTAAGYMVTAASRSGNAFVIAKADDGSLTRTCTPAGKGGCPAAGAW
jgi:type IV pilus assembly protein PilA